MEKTHAVVLRQFPQNLNLSQTCNCLNEIQKAITMERPRLVLDCSHMSQIDDAVIYLLLGCLEEAIKRNGDVKLAAVPSSVATVLIKSGVSRLFEMFSTSAEAVSSFSHFADNTQMSKSASKRPSQKTESAA